MSYIDVDIEEGRRCAGVITALAAELGSLVEGETCEMCHAIESYCRKLNTLASDLLASTEAYADIENARKGG